LATSDAHRRKKVMPARFLKLSGLRKLRECEQVAAVCYRLRGDEIEFLLIRTRGSGRWTFPKGSTEPGLTHAQAAALEAFEEAGVHGRIEEVSFARYFRWTKTASEKTSAGTPKLVQAHLCEVLRLSKPKESDRGRTWFSPADARRNLRQRRDHHDAAEFARVIDKAVARIEQLQKQLKANSVVRNTTVQPSTYKEDALQRVKIEADLRSYSYQSRMPLTATGRLDARRKPLPLTQPRKLLSGEVLQFDAANATLRKAKATGTRG
jgi:8-oxo-dGTP pyrophosphatase MutT (NUDIX family)